MRNWILFLGLVASISAFATQPMTKADMIAYVQATNKTQIWNELLAIDANGYTKFGKCRVGDARQCHSTGNCFCSAYFNTAAVGSLNMTGWAKNPSSGDSTGCMVSPNWGGGPSTCWGGYVPGSFCTSDHEANAKAMLLHALQHTGPLWSGSSISNDDVCGLTPFFASLKVEKKVRISMQASNLLFVKPSESCANGKALCGTKDIGSAVGSMVSFNQLPEKFCDAAYKSLQKTVATFQSQGTPINVQASFLTCQQYQSAQLDSSVIQQAQSVVGQLMQSYGVDEFLPFCNGFETAAQYAALTDAQVALCFVSKGKDSSKLVSFIRSRAEALSTSQVDSAQTAFNALQATNSTCTLQDAINYVQSGGSSSSCMNGGNG